MLSQPHMPQPATPPARSWYVQVDGQAYGPFSDQQLWQFMCEGRVNAQSLITQDPSQPYRVVSSDLGLMNWLSQVPEKQQKTDPQPQSNVKPSVFVVMAEIRSGRGMDFLKNLQSLGHVERIGDTLWLLRAAASADDIRNVLSQPLSSDDRLFILDSFENRTAWFNIGSDMDQRIRQLWDVER